ncbi:1-phosphofructokinase family hexose kinase [Mucilaginibacter sp. UR6-11]|uniref:1-phosphofructokinase family hexose kinase n=1 Tax=Mucilaginibacter sp. UR6-11 TaxID=1435644 RepID=UPI001E52ACBC|nr:1-phosphofructokinase family hexose kinase [Mucilaginibacter sp. UR6-11]MCC8426409.1 1-phosphofructokinase family hexose kinase [Mucilaginibacter sp. UR6-11]
MTAIVTITFNPALDVNTSVQDMMPEKKLKCSDPVHEPGGGGINVARAIKKLGGEALAVYLSGGDAGKKITALLSAESVSSLVIPIKGVTRQNLIILDRSSNGQYLFDMPGPLVSEAEWRGCLNAVDQISGIDYLVVSGSLPNGVRPDIFFELADIARRKHAKLVVDTAGEALQLAVRAGAYLVKPNLKELGLLAGERNITGENVADAARKVLQGSACQVIVVSMGSKGALLVTKDECVKVVPPAVTPLSTVGAGDSLVGGLVLALSKNMTLADAVKFGVACGTSATISPGAELCRKVDADRLYNMIKDKPVTSISLNGAPHQLDL